ncbi:MAG: glutamyl-tRNA(Gln) amidotransferase subunit E [Candidatus Cloacimonetes bacterium 4572_55]|nr:MAG: glutamyl-tRNA(Gln) amidotransferase subunit E [Candidatus Cloacimonetes bacterium 4572_55]
MIPLLKSFEDMTEKDYAELGLKAGLEIHQQLLTEKKLFCRCPAGLYNLEYDAEILRHMRPTLSELGEYDGTALMEFKTKKNIIYRINHETVCTYEMDDTPPFEINPHALDIALKMAMLLNYKLVSEIHIARKQYLDGSIPTGFQRTTIVGIDGWLSYRNRKIGLIQLGLEEDACREISDIGHERIYITDRLGMPLTEVVTEPAMRTPQEVAEVANIIRWSVRSMGNVRTGIGAARQDVNVSIAGGTRIEIKGVSRIPMIPLLVYNEAQRQYSLLRIRAELHRRGITEKTFEAHSVDVSHILSKTSYEPIASALKNNEVAHCVNLKGFLGILSQPTQIGKVFSKEISDRARVVACLTRLPNILTSESKEETVTSFSWNKIRKAINAGDQDSLILVWGDQKDVKVAIQEIIIRAKETTQGVPSETRQALSDGTNGFERILPGADRMYPDTDLPPLEITDDRIERIRKSVPESLWDREKKYRDMGIPEHLITRIACTPRAILFENLANKFSVPPTWIAIYLFEKQVAWRRDGLPVKQLTTKNWEMFFSYASQQPALLELGDDLFRSFLDGSDIDLEKRILEVVPARIQLDDLTGLIRETIHDQADAIPKTPEKKCRFFMGLVMKKCRGHILGRVVNHKLWQYIQKNGEKE